ncbi:universal stress protein [Streptomyces umbrinus]|uniref:universal stress protein n=1 Tax=Streptomyces umbrinus TaxID=67370 RepID=UPI00167EE3A3|nr:universal stress protein [Streptomyces umbrinus]MCR3724204.1 nucleotide-binding universal stress UspA family protein [Streptomyces umbrinus]GHH41010.1 universal stress protein [Streptomyces umbrinus]
MTRPITVGVDGSAESLAAVHWAAREAVRRSLALRVVHAWEKSDGEDRTGDVRDALAETAREVTDRHADLPVTTDLLEGDRVEALVAEAADAETLVLGTRGHGAIVGFLLGSVGQQVVAESTRPVVLVRAGDLAESEAAGREIVVGQQGGPDDSAAALEFAFETAAARGAGVRVVRAWSLPTVFTFSPGSLRLADEAGGLEQYEEKALSEALLPFTERFPDVRVTRHVEMGSAGEVLLTAAAPAQLLVVGRRAHRSAVGARVGSVAHAAMHHAPCPVAVVPPA